MQHLSAFVGFHPVATPATVTLLAVVAAAAEPSICGVRPVLQPVCWEAASPVAMVAAEPAPHLPRAVPSVHHRLLLLRLPEAAGSMATGGDGAVAASQRSLPWRALGPLAAMLFADTPATAPAFVTLLAPTLGLPTLLDQSPAVVAEIRSRR